MREPPQISIYHKEDLRTYLPQLDVSKFERLSGGKKFHGPCPVCGGTDRFNVWFWSSKNIWLAGCSHGDHVYNRKGEAKKSVCLNYLSGDMGHELTREEMAEIEKARRESAEREWREKCQNFKKISGLQIQGYPIWDYYHMLMLEKQDLIDDLMGHDGITLDSIREYKIGFNPGYKVYYKDDDSYEMFEAITFPHFHWLQIDGVWAYWLTNIRHRLLGATKDKYRPLIGGLGVDYFNAWIPGTDRMILTEGEKKSIRLKQEGISTVGIWGTQAWYDWWIPEWKKMAPKQIAILMDHEQDERQQARIWEHGERIVNAINSKGPKIASQILLPTVGKIDDQLNSGEISVDDLIQLLELASPVQIR